MADGDFLLRKPVLAPSQDYGALRSEGVSLIERLGSEHWTDYNVHDPGITLLELLCYAITELGYRSAYPVRDLLTGFKDGKPVPLGRFHTAADVLPCRPVTFDDLRKLLADLPGVRNAWIEKHESVVYRLDARHATLTDDPKATENPPLAGLYDVFLEYEEDVTETSTGYRSRARLGRPDNSGPGGYLAAGGRGIEFTALDETRLDAVYVYPEAAGSVTVRLTDTEGQELARATVEAAEAGVGTGIPLGFVLEAGKGYRLDARGSAVRLFRNHGFTPGTGPGLRLERGHPNGAEYYFFYDWEVAYEAASLTRGAVKRAVVDRLHRQRNLCEDWVEMCELKPEEIGFCAEIELAPGADAEEVAAEIHYRLHHHVSPAPRFYAIEQLLARGRTVEQIFEGPRLDHGFIDDEEFRRLKRRCEIRVSDVIELVMDVPGVAAVKSAALLSFVDGRLRAKEDWLLTLSPDRFRAPAYRWERSKLVFYRGTLPYYANRERAAGRLKEKKAADIESKLKGHARDLDPPAGEFQNLADYHPAQNELPMAYCVGQIRVPESAPALRQAQSRQLKAYLMFFEQLLANHLAQLAHLGDLFSWEAAASASYFTRPVAGIAGLEEIHPAGHFDAAEKSLKQAELEKIIETPALAVSRRNRFLEHLMGRYCEGLGEYSGLMAALLRSAAPGKLLRDRRAFLADYREVGAERAGAYDYRFPQDPANVAGYQRRVYRLLGIEDLRRGDLAGHRFRIAKLPGEPERWRFVLDGEGGIPVFESIECETRAAIEALLDFALSIGGDAANWVETEDGNQRLVQRCAEDKEEKVGETVAGPLEPVREYFARIGAAEGFHVIENLLLRRRTKKDPFLPVQLNRAGRCDCPEVSDPYSLRMTVLLPSWSKRFRDLKFRQFVEDTLRREAPAHVYARICWISHGQMREFENAYNDWCERLAEIAGRPASCHTDPEAGAARRGRFPLPPGNLGADSAYARSLRALIETLHRLTTVYPLARLHDCREASGDTPQVSLNNTSLGTF
jgi:hypothetical protein